MRKSEIFGILTSKKADAKQKKRAHRKLIRRYDGNLSDICYTYVPVNEIVGKDEVKINYDPDKNICYYKGFSGTYAECKEYIRSRVRNIEKIIKSDPKFTDYMGLHVDPLLARSLNKYIKLVKIPMSGDPTWTTWTNAIVYDDKIAISVSLGNMCLREMNVVPAIRGGWIQKRNVTKYYYYDDSTGTSKLIEIDGRHREKSILVKIDEKRIVNIGEYGLEVGYYYMDTPGNYVIWR